MVYFRDLFSSIFNKGHKKVLCPFCLEKSLLKGAPHRCHTGPPTCKKEVDSVLAKHWGKNLPGGLVIPPKDDYSPKLECRYCHKLSAFKICLLKTASGHQAPFAAPFGT
jgi:hypothetical protein